MRVPKRHWQEMTTAEFVAAAQSGDIARWIAVLPVAAIEQHGPHLAVATDAAIAAGMIAEVLARLPQELPATFLPLQAIGKSNEHIASPGTLTLSWDTAIRAWLEIAESVRRAGVQKLVVVNAHGGNVPLIDIIVRELRVRHRMLAVHTAWMRFGDGGVADAAEARTGIHGGTVETALMLHFRPDLVAMAEARDFASAQADFERDFVHLRAHGAHAFGWQAQDLNPSGTVGDATRATAALGARTAAHQAEAFIALLTDVDAFDLTRLA
jgi:creatinine amidohydrolase